MSQRSKGSTRKTRKDKLPEEVKRERQRTYQREWAKRNPDKVLAKAKKYRNNHHDKVLANERRPERREAQKWHMIKSRYGITREAYENMFAGQDFRCAVCGDDAPTAKHAWHLDHDHVTEEVRGILCGHCNVMLGRARDNPAFLRAGAEYLEAHASG